MTGGAGGGGARGALERPEGDARGHGIRRGAPGPRPVIRLQGYLARQTPLQPHPQLTLFPAP